MAWQYFNDTGITGGTANPSDQTFYIDSYNGNDLNVGSNVAPFKTIQKALDSATQGSFTTQGADLIIAGVFDEGDFVNLRAGMTLIAEGDVVLDGTNHSIFTLSPANATWRNVSFNFNRYNTRARRRYGRLTFKNWSDGVMFGNSNNAGGEDTRIYDCTFENCERVGGENVYEGGGTGAAYIWRVEGCVFKDIGLFVALTNRSDSPEILYCERNTFINCNVVSFDYGSDYTNVRSCYFDQPTKISIDSPLINALGSFDYCHVEGTLTNKIQIDGSFYNNNEIAGASFAFWNPNGRPSTGATEFNALTPNDYTYPNTAINATAGYLGTYIGAYGIADGAQAIADSNWVADVKVDKTSVPTEAVLIGTPEGIIETTNGVHVVTGSKPKKLKRLTLPDEVLDYSTGKVIDTTKSISGGTPSIRTVEIDFSSDSGSTYHGSWVEVPINGEPKIDGAGVGNGNPAYNPATGVDILLTHIKYRITLRNDEVAV